MRLDIATDLLDTAFVAGTMGKKAAWQQTNPFHNISKMCGAGAWR